ncbi:MAG TPA: ATP-binding protein [Spirochaetia bacterium]|nr:ATP-binding protein [Spirochaetia bacterium]
MDQESRGHPGLDPRIFVTIVEESPASVLITDPQGSIEYVNGKFSRLTGYSREEVTGKNPRLLKSGAQGPEVYAELWQTIRAGREWRGELCNRKKNGELYWELASISAVHAADGSIAHYLAIKEDITDRKGMEALLRQATAAAEAASRAKSRFLADMSHELRTPLNSILGFSQLMELQGSDSLSDKQREYLRWIREGGEHLLEMVNDVLDLSKVEAGKVELEKSGIDPGLLIRRVLTTVRTLAAKKHLRLVMSVPDHLGILDADEVRIKQVLYNLLSNAIKFTPAEKRIGVDARGEAGTLVLRVWDEGIGIPAADLPRLFEPYTQSRSRHGEGTGLGLAIVKRLVELHEGTVSVESVVDTGSSFTVRIPGLHPAPAPAPRDAAPARAAAEEVPDLAGRTALVVDDSPANRALMERILGAFGCTVLAAASGEEALDIAGRAPCDLIFMDIQLPGMNGVEAMRKLREQGVRGPFVALTAFAMKGDAERFLAEGFDGFIAKPVRIAEIVEFLEGV